MVIYKIEQWNHNCPVLHSQHSCINKISFATNSSGNAFMRYYYLKFINFLEVENVTFHWNLFLGIGYFNFFFEVLFSRTRSKFAKFSKNNPPKKVSA